MGPFAYLLLFDYYERYASSKEKIGNKHGWAKEKRSLSARLLYMHTLALVRLMQTAG